MAIGQRPGDWVGYPVGVPGAVPATVGFRGFLDFMGYSVGMSAAAGGSDTTIFRMLLGVG